MQERKNPSPGDDLERLRQASQGDEQVLAAVFAEHADRLTRMVRLRLHNRLRSRVAPSDVLQEAYLQAARELPRYVERPELPVFLWLRTIAMQKLTEMHRQHLGVQARDAKREVSLDQGSIPAASSVIVAAQLIGHLTSPSEAAMRAEMQRRLQENLLDMDVNDREILALRHFERLSNQEAAAVLGLSEKAASNRYVRALLVLKKALSVFQGMSK